jgi:hypothetical protein
LLLLKEGEIWLTEPFGNKGKRMPVARQKSGASISGLLLALRGNYQLTETPSGLILRNR